MRNVYVFYFLPKIGWIFVVIAVVVDVDVVRVLVVIFHKHSYISVASECRIERMKLSCNVHGTEFSPSACIAFFIV